MSTAPATLEIAADPVPLEKWDDGSIRVSGSRMHFNIVIGIYQEEGSVEGLRGALPDLALPVAHRLVAYYLAHQHEVDAWMQQLEREADEIWEQFENEHPTREWRERLKARWAEMRATPPD